VIFNAEKQEKKLNITEKGKKNAHIDLYERAI